MLGKEIYVLCAGGGEVAMEGEFSLGNRPQRHSRMTRPIPVTNITDRRSHYQFRRDLLSGMFVADGRRFKRAPSVSDHISRRYEFHAWQTVFTDSWRSLASSSLAASPRMARRQWPSPLVMALPIMALLLLSPTMVAYLCRGTEHRLIAGYQL
jgi:hypothetical protein